MKIALVRPNYRTHIITPPLGLGYLSSYLKSQGYEVEIIDGLLLKLSNEELAKRCESTDLVGISVLSFYFLKTIDLSQKLKRKGKTVVVGGPHATALPQLTLEKTGADFIVIGEGERTLYRLVKALEKGKKEKEIKIRGVYSSHHSKTDFPKFISPLSKLPFPDWEQIDPRNYPKAPHGAFVKNFPVAPILTTRGCPYSCKFCASPYLWQRKIRFRRPREVITEIKYLVDNFDVREIHIEDDNFTFRKKHAETICRLIIKENLKISLSTPNGIRADKIDRSLLALMKKAGFYSIAFGVESANRQILKNMGKKTDLEVIKKAVKLASSLGFSTQGFFIFGLPGETKESIQESVDLTKTLPFEKAHFVILDVLPGSQLWQELDFENKVNWRLDSYREISWLPPTIDYQTLANSQKIAFRQFYFRPKILWKLIKMVRFDQLKYLLQRINDFKILK